MSLSDDGCIDTLIVLPWSNGDLEFRDKYRDGPQRFTGLGFFWYVIAPYADAPEVVILGKANQCNYVALADTYSGNNTLHLASINVRGAITSCNQPRLS